MGRYFAPQAVLNLALSVWLVPHLGNVGVALGTLLPAIALEYWFLSFVLSELEVSWREFMRAVRPVGAAAFVTYVPLVLAYTRLPADSPLLPAIAVVCSLADALVLWRILDERERSVVMARVPQSLRRRAGALRSAEALPARPDQRL